MIDSGATGNFISNTFVTKNCIPYQAKEKPYKLTITDESPSNYGDGWVQMETKESTLAIGQHLNRLTWTSRGSQGTTSFWEYYG